MVQLVLPGVAAYDTGSTHFIPSVEIKMLFMSVG